MRFSSRHYKAIAAIGWLLLLAAGFGWGYSRGLTTTEILAAAYTYASGNPYAPVLYIGLYALRSFTFVPAMWLTVASGSLFGFGLGVACTVVGENLSAAIAYATARFFGTAPTEPDEEAVQELTPFRRTLRTQAFPTVVVLRAAYLPFDVVNYGCGLLHVPWWPYFFGTFVGILPPMLTFVSFGASVKFQVLVERLDDLHPTALLDGRQLAISLALLTVSALIAWFAHRYRQSRQ